MGSIQPTDEYELDGYCCHCGQCCSELVVPASMLDEKNIIGGLKMCKYAIETQDGIFCTIALEKAKIDPSIDLSQEMIVDEEIKTTLSLDVKAVTFVETNFKFPDPSCSQFHPFRFNLAERCPKCTFRHVKVE